MTLSRRSFFRTCLQACRSLNILCLALVAASLPCRALTSVSEGREGTTVFLAASLQPVLLAIEKRHGLTLKLVPASSGLLARQIAAGAPADIYLTADRKWTAWLEARNVRLLARKTFLSNRLAFVEPIVDSRVDSRVDSLADSLSASIPRHDEDTLSKAETRTKLVSATRIAVGDPSHVPVGLYAQQVFASLSLDKPTFLAKLVPLVNTRATVLHIERAEAPLGIVYRSDALFAKRSVRAKMRVAGYLPSALHDPIAYDMLLLGEKGRSLYILLSSASARQEFRSFGFTPL